MNRPLQTLLAFLLLYSSSVTAQVEPLLRLENRVMKGDKQALYELSNYLDNEWRVIETLGHHILQTSESSVALRIIDENILFVQGESPINNNLTCEQFRTFLNANTEALTYDSIAGIFLLTSLKKRTAVIDFRTISSEKKAAIHNKLDSLCKVEWIMKENIDSLIRERDPQALLQAASTLFKSRNRFNRYDFQRKEYLTLLEALTGLEFSVEDHNGQMTWEITDHYEDTAALHLLIYWINNYQQFKWDETSALFVNESIQARPISEEESLFQLLSNEDSATAVNTFNKLAAADPVKVRKAAREYEKAIRFYNHNLPYSPVSYLITLSAYTQYCRETGIDYHGSAALQECKGRLMADLSFQHRRHLEDSLAASITLSDISALEYQTIVNQRSWSLIYSTGRILDIFYSKHWSEVWQDEAQLTHYLKKIALFDNTGTKGISNLYLSKFKGNGAAKVEWLNKLSSNDSTFLKQLRQAKQDCLKAPIEWQDLKESGNKTTLITTRQLKKKIKAIGRSKKKDFDKEIQLKILLERLSFDQIGIVLERIDEIQLRDHALRYSFLHAGFGFPREWNFEDKNTRRQFLAHYNMVSEYDLYAHHLDLLGIKYKNENGTLDYESIFYALQFNIVTAFVSGGGKNNNEVYLLIKLLELTHHTTLGFSKSLSHAGTGMHGYVKDRSTKWRKFLLDSQLVKIRENEAPSFSEN